MMPVMPMTPTKWALNEISRPWGHGITSARKGPCKHDAFFQQQRAAAAWATAAFNRKQYIDSGNWRQGHTADRDCTGIFNEATLMFSS